MPTLRKNALLLGRIVHSVCGQVEGHVYQVFKYNIIVFTNDRKRISVHIDNIRLGRVGRPHRFSKKVSK